MLKKLWNTLNHSSQDQVVSSKGFSVFSLWLLATGYLLLALVSCAPKYAEKPSREGMSLAAIMTKMNTVRTIEAVLAIDYEKNDATMSGDAHLDLSPSSLNLRIYYLGFLYGELSEDNGVIHSKPKFDK